MNAVRKSKRLGFLLWAVTIAPVTQIASAQETPSDYQQVLKTVGKTGDYKSNVLMLMGDLVLTQEEVNPVMSALRDHRLEVTALHNHFFWDDPRVFFMHIHGHGKATDLADQIKPAVDLIGHAPTAATAPKSTTSAPAEGALDTARIAKIVGHEGEQKGAVYKITIGRDDLSVKEMGATINARMGLNTWAAFAGTNRFAQDRQVRAFVQGVTAAAVGAIAGAAYILGRRSLVDLPTVAIGLVALAILMLTRKIPEPILILAADGVGVLLHGTAG